MPAAQSAHTTAAVSPTDTPVERLRNNGGQLFRLLADQVFVLALHHDTDQGFGPRRAQQDAPPAIEADLGILYRPLNRLTGVDIDTLLQRHINHDLRKF